MATNDDLYSMLRDSFSSDEEQMFLHHFQLYLSYDSSDFVVDLDDVWKWMEFTRKCSATRLLSNRFVVDLDYISTTSNLLHPEVKQVSHGGQNKELIMLTVDTFKEMCMLANTDRGQQTRKYYLKMEKICLEHTKKLHEQQASHMVAIERHNNLKAAYAERPCVYILKIDHSSDVVKLGETDNIKTRLVELQSQYKESLLVEVFPCLNPHSFEQYILKRPDVKPYRIAGTELIQFNDEFTLAQLVKNIKKSLKTFNHDEKLFQQKKFLAQSETAQMYSKERSLLLEAIMKEDDPDKKEMLYNMLTNLRPPQVEIEEDNAESDKEFNDTEDDDITSNRKVHKYSPDDLFNPIATYPSFKAAARSCKDPTIHDYHVRAATINNTIFCEHRWFCVDGDSTEEFVVPPTQEPPPTASSRRQGRVAQLNQEKNKVRNVFPNQTIAAKTTNTLACSITTAITTQRKLNGFYWMMYSDLTDELKQTFDGELPEEVRSSTCSKTVRRIDPATDEVLETYPCVQNVCSLFKTSHKTIHKVSRTGDIFKGFKWSIG